MTVEQLILRRISNISELEQNIFYFEIQVPDKNFDNGDRFKYILNLNNNTFLNNIGYHVRISNKFVLTKEMVPKKISKSWTDRCGGYYLTVSILSKAIRLHRLVTYFKYGEDLFLSSVDHIDGNRENNKVCNLKIGTHQDNMKNAVERKAWGNQSFNRGKMRPDDFIKIIDMIKDGHRNKEIAGYFNIDQSVISRIRNRDKRLEVNFQYLQKEGYLNDFYSKDQ